MIEDVYPVASRLIGPRWRETIAELKRHNSQIFRQGVLKAPPEPAARRVSAIDAAVAL